MGHTHYRVSDRALRAADLGYYSKGVAEIFTQQKERKIHESMSSQNIDKRECRDSEAHPNTVPIILALDLTGSMGTIPHELIKDGLPTLMGNLIQKGLKDASLLFLGVGDHECDSYPLQVGQFESGDEELDMWLTRTYIEGGGGGNAGESYLLAWYFAANHTVTDSFEKRKQKGFLFTCGDEPCLKRIPKTAIKEIMGNTARGQAVSDVDLLSLAQEKYNVFHIHVLQGSAGKHSRDYWKELLGQNCIEVTDYKNIANVIVETILSHTENITKPVKQPKEKSPQIQEKIPIQEEIL